MYPYSEKSAIICSPLQIRDYITMPNWVEAVIAYLKKQVSLRFTMVWLLYLVALWVLLPESFFGFINAKPIIGSVNNINAILFIIPASFLLSDVTKRICKISDAASGVLKSRLEISQRKRDITFQCEKLNPGEINLISKFAEQGSQMLYIPPGDRFLHSLLMKGLIPRDGRESTMEDGLIVYLYKLDDFVWSKYRN